MIERLLLHFVFAFVATTCFAILLNVPRRAYLAGGVIGGGDLGDLRGNVLSPARWLSPFKLERRDFNRDSRDDGGQGSAPANDFV